MLSQALYWSARTQDPQGWFYKTAVEWERETSLSLSQQETARKTLRRFPFWHEALRRTPATLHFRVDLEKLLEALLQLAENPQTGIGKSSNLDRAKHANKNHKKPPTSLDNCRKPYKEAETTRENTPETIPIPPTPLKRGDERSNSTKAGKDADDLLSEFQLRLKDDMLNASFQSKNLDAGDYDRYFRDTWFSEIRDGVVFANGTNPALTAEGLRKYMHRLKQIFRKLSGVEADFQMMRIGDGGAKQR